MEASRRAAALAAKDAGNALFKSGDWRGAAAAYTEAIALDAGDRAFYSNRSAARLSLGDAAGALADADAATALDGGWPKAHYRRGLALRGTGDLRGAVLALERGLAALPGAPCPKWAHAAEFREALATVHEARLAAAAAREGGGGRAACQPVEPPLPKWNYTGRRLSEDGKLLRVSVPRACAGCRRPGATLRCGRCYAVAYCTQACQRAHWPAAHAASGECVPLPTPPPTHTGDAYIRAMCPNVELSPEWAAELVECIRSGPFRAPGDVDVDGPLTDGEKSALTISEYAAASEHEVRAPLPHLLRRRRTSRSCAGWARTFIRTRVCVRATARRGCWLRRACSFRSARARRGATRSCAGRRSLRSAGCCKRTRQPSPSLRARPVAACGASWRRRRTR